MRCGSARADISDRRADISSHNTGHLDITNIINLEMADSPPLLPALLPPSTPSLAEVPFNLPPPLYRADPALWSRLNDHLWSTCGLLHHERATLGAVFQHLPTPAAPATPGLIDRLLTLSVEHLRLLARLFTVALLHSRAWGGPRGSTAATTPATNASFSVSSSLRGSPSTSGAEPSTLTIYEPLFAALAIPPLPAVQPPPSTGSSASSAPPSSARCAKQKANCLRRHLDTCPITLKTATIEHAHIIPHSVVSLSNQAVVSPFWMMLGILLGPSLRDVIFAILSPSTGPSTTNSLALDTSLHKLIDNGTLHLAPVAPSRRTFSPSTCTHYDVRFTWWGSSAELGVCLTTVQRDPTAQVVGGQHVRTGPPRVIGDGDRFRLFTTDAERFPLPHPLLLDLHGVLWRMLATAGMAEPGGARKRRLGGAEDDADADDDDAGSARGTPRGGQKHGAKRRKKEMPPPPPPPPKQDAAPKQNAALDSFDLKWVDFRLGVLAAERREWQDAYSSDCGESGASEGSDGEEVCVV